VRACVCACVLCAQPTIAASRCFLAGAFLTLFFFAFLLTEAMRFRMLARVSSSEDSESASVLGSSSSLGRVSKLPRSLFSFWREAKTAFFHCFFFGG
jgi:hypothetical protein